MNGRWLFVTYLDRSGFFAVVVVKVCICMWFHLLGLARMHFPWLQMMLFLRHTTRLVVVERMCME